MKRAVTFFSVAINNQSQGFLRVGTLAVTIKNWIDYPKRVSEIETMKPTLSFGRRATKHLNGRVGRQTKLEDDGHPHNFLRPMERSFRIHLYTIAIFTKSTFLMSHVQKVPPIAPIVAMGRIFPGKRFLLMVKNSYIHRFVIWEWACKR